MTVMDEAHRKDMAAHRRIEDAARALRRLLDDQNALSQLRPAHIADADWLHGTLKREAARIVRVWD